MGRIQTPKAPTLVKRLASNGGAIRKLQVTGAIAPVAAGGGFTVVGAGGFVWNNTAFFSNTRGHKPLIGDTFLTEIGDTSGIIAPGSVGAGTGTFQLGLALWLYQLTSFSVVLPDISAFISGDTDILTLRTCIRPDGSLDQTFSYVDTLIFPAKSINTSGVYGGAIPPEWQPTLSGMMGGTAGLDLAVVLDLVTLNVATGLAQVIDLSVSGGESSGVLQFLNLGNITF